MRGPSERASGGSRLGLLLLPLGVVLYSAYVAGGIFFGVALLSITARQERPLQLSLPLIAQTISLPRIGLPFSPSPLALIPDWTGTERVNILVLGVDQREDERAIGLPTRSDTLMVASVHPREKTAALISFPRDLWVSIPGFGEERVNAAFRIGELRRVEGGGPALAAHTVERNFGLRTPYYVLVDFRGFEELVDALGGVVVDVPRPLKDDEYPTADYGLERVFFLPGPQIMKGSTALKYARTRHADSDFARMARQQQVLLGMRDRALRLNMLPQLPGFIEQGMRAIQTNLGPAELLSLAKLASQIETDALSTLVVERELVTPFQGIDGASLLLPNRASIQRAIQRTLADPRIIAEAAQIQVSTTLRLSTVARQAIDRLAAHGLQNVRQVSFDGPDPDVTTVVVSADKPRSVAVLMQALGLGPESVMTAAEESTVDIRVVLGRDLRFPAQQS